MFFLGKTILALTVMGLAPGGLHSDPFVEEARTLVRLVLEDRASTGVRIRAKLTRTDKETGLSTSRQLLIKSRLDKGRTSTLYQVLWPQEEKGTAFLFHSGGGKSLETFEFLPPDSLRVLDASDLNRPLFDSDITLEHLVEQFWNWPNPRVIGEETVARKRCRIIEFRAPSRLPSGLARVHAWVSPDLKIALRAEGYHRSGDLLFRVEAERLMRTKERWSAGRIVFTPGNERSETVLEGSRMDRDVSIDPEDFTFEGLQEAARADSSARGR